MNVYYNEIDPKAAAWLRELIKRGLIADGVVDERSIIDVAPDELREFTQCHFFAGIGVWSYALRSAGWADDRPVWTGSCPCQPFSAAGRRGGVDDERHLWPHWHHLISQCQPAIVFGEQVASKDGLGWLDLVSTDMEATGYAIGAADLCAAGVGAPHIRQRLFFGAVRLADADGWQRGRLADGEGRQPDRPQTRRQQGDSEPERSGSGIGLADAERSEWGEGGLCGLRQADGAQGSGAAAEPSGSRDGSGLADADDAGSQGRAGVPERAGERAARPGGVEGGLADAAVSGWGQGIADAGRLRSGDQAEGATGRSAVDGAVDDSGRPRTDHGGWAAADWLFCRDGKWRPVEPGTFPLAHGSAQRVGRLRGYGNAIVAQVAQTFVESMMDAMK